MKNTFTLNNVDIEVDIRVTPCGPDIQDVCIGNWSVLELFDGTELERLVTEYVDEHYREWVAEEHEAERIDHLERKEEERRERELLEAA